MSLGELAVAYKNGDKTVYDDLFTGILKKATKSVKDQMFGGYEEDAKDIAMEIAIKVIGDVPNLPKPEGVEAYISAISEHKVIDFKRSARYRHEMNDNATTFLDEETDDGLYFIDSYQEDGGTRYMEEYKPEVQLDEKTRKEIVREILDSIPKEQSIAIQMMYYYDMSRKEIAEELGITESKVKGRLQLASKKAKEGVEKYEKREGIRLHSEVAFPFFLYLLGKYKQEYPDVVEGEKMFSELADIATSSSVPKNSNLSNSSKNPVKATGETISRATSKVGASIGTKIAISVAVGIGIAGGGYAIYSNNKTSDAVIADSINEQSKETTTAETSTPEPTSEINTFTDDIFSFEMPDDWKADSVYWDSSTQTYLDADNGTGACIRVIRVYQNDFNIDEPHLAIHTNEIDYSGIHYASGMQHEIDEGYLSESEFFTMFGEKKYCVNGGTYTMPYLFEYDATGDFDEFVRLSANVVSYISTEDYAFGDVYFDFYHSDVNSETSENVLNTVLSTFEYIGN